MKFPCRWLHNRGLPPPACRIIRVTGDSMEPALSDGAAVLVYLGSGTTPPRVTADLRGESRPARRSIRGGTARDETRGLTPRPPSPSPPFPALPRPGPRNPYAALCGHQHLQRSTPTGSWTAPVRAPACDRSPSGLSQEGKTTMTLIDALHPEDRRVLRRLRKRIANREFMRRSREARKLCCVGVDLPIEAGTCGRMVHAEAERCIHCAKRRSWLLNHALNPIEDAITDLVEDGDARRASVDTQNRPVCPPGHTGRYDHHRVMTSDRQRSAVACGVAGIGAAASLT